MPVARTCPCRVCGTCGATGHSARECLSETVGICNLNSCGDEAHQQPQGVEPTRGLWTAMDQLGRIPGRCRLVA